MSNSNHRELQDVEVEHKEEPYRGFFSVQKWRLRHTLFRGGWSNWLSRDLVIRKPAVGVLLITPETRQVVLIEQFRPGALAADQPAWLLEIVAGLVEEQESPEDVARREALEEAGCVINEVYPICKYLPSPGGSDEVLSLFYATVSLPSEDKYYGLEEEGEDIRIRIMDWDHAFKLVNDGTINNASTIIALQWLQLNQSRF